MKVFISILITFIIGHNCYAYNPFWVNIDKRLIKNVVKLDKNNPKEVEKYFQKKRKIEKEELGFGWSVWDTGAYGGYISVSATFYYYKNEIVSYSLNTRFPSEKGLKKRYKKWFKDFFLITENEKLFFDYKRENILTPLKEYQGKLNMASVPLEILNYMTPESGIAYGYRGGAGMGLLPNRRSFIQIHDGLTNEQVILMMYSINPASRLTAIEHYYRHKADFDNSFEIEKWISTNTNECPFYETLTGCFVHDGLTRELIKSFQEEDWK